MRNMSEAMQQVSIPLRTHLDPIEEALFHKPVSRFLGGSDLWPLTSQRLLMVGKKGLVEKTLLDSGENVVYYETGGLQFSGNVHLLTNQHILILDIG